MEDWKKEDILKEIIKKEQQKHNRLFECFPVLT